MFYSALCGPRGVKLSWPCVIVAGRTISLSGQTWRATRGRRFYFCQWRVSRRGAASVNPPDGQFTSSVSYSRDEQFIPLVSAPRYICRWITGRSGSDMFFFARHTPTVRVVAKSPRDNRDCVDFQTDFRRANDTIRMQIERLSTGND